MLAAGMTAMVSSVASQSRTRVVATLWDGWVGADLITDQNVVWFNINNRLSSFFIHLSNRVTQLMADCFVISGLNTAYNSKPPVNCNARTVIVKHLNGQRSQIIGLNKLSLN